VFCFVDTLHLSWKFPGVQGTDRGTV